MEHALRAEEQRDQQTAEPAVAVEEGMHGLELDVEQPGFHERRQPALLLVHELFEGVECRAELGDRGRHVDGVSRRVPPIHFCVVWNSPGFFAAPRPSRRRRSCISRMRRSDSGSSFIRSSP